MPSDTYTYYNMKTKKIAPVAISTNAIKRLCLSSMRSVSEEKRLCRLIIKVKKIKTREAKKRIKIMEDRHKEHTEKVKNNQDEIRKILKNLLTVAIQRKLEAVEILVSNISQNPDDIEVNEKVDEIIKAINNITVKYRMPTMKMVIGLFKSQVENPNYTKDITEKNYKEVLKSSLEGVKKNQGSYETGQFHEVREQIKKDSSENAEKSISEMKDVFDSYGLFKQQQAKKPETIRIEILSEMGMDRESGQKEKVREDDNVDRDLTPSEEQTPRHKISLTG